MTENMDIILKLPEFVQYAVVFAIVFIVWEVAGTVKAIVASHYAYKKAAVEAEYESGDDHDDDETAGIDYESATEGFAQIGQNAVQLLDAVKHGRHTEALEGLVETGICEDRQHANIVYHAVRNEGKVVYADGPAVKMPADEPEYRPAGIIRPEDVRGGAKEPPHP